MRSTENDQREHKDHPGRVVETIERKSADFEKCGI
jgi:hypothetical protein